MTLADYAITSFAVLNCGRVVAYVPQLIRVYRDPHGAAAVSMMTWSLFTAANLATVTYALSVTGDLVVGVVFSLNAGGCLAVVLLTAFKRMELRSRRKRELPRDPASSDGRAGLATRMAPSLRT